MQIPPRGQGCCTRQAPAGQNCARVSNVSEPIFHPRVIEPALRSLGGC